MSTQAISVTPRPLDFRATHLTGAIRAARLLSDAASPPVVFAALGLATAVWQLPLLPGLVWGIVYGVLVSGIPMGVIIYLLKTGRASDIHLSNPRERRVPYLVGLLGALTALLILKALNGPALSMSLALSSVIGLGTLSLINHYWLISNHTASMTLAAVFAGCAFSFASGVILSVLVGLLFAARLYLKRHTLAQLISGVMVGAASVTIVAALGWFI